MKDNTIPNISVIVMTKETPLMILKRCIKSIQEQTLKNIEIILLDSNQKNSSYKKAIQDETELLNDIIYLEIPEEATYINGKNVALSKCSGKYVTFISAQDSMPPKRFENVMDIFSQKNEYDVVYTDMKIQEKNILETSDEHTSTQEFQFLSQLFIRRECFDKMGDFDGALIAQSDEEMWFRMNYLLEVYHLSSEETTIYVNPDFYIKNTIHQNAVAYRQIYVKYADYFNTNKAKKKEIYKKIAESYKASGEVFRFLQFYIKAFFTRNRKKTKKETLLPMGHSQIITLGELLPIIKKKRKILHFILIQKDSAQMLDTAKKLVCNLHSSQKTPKRKIASIAADKINASTLNENIDQLTKNCLVIDNAGTLSQDQIVDLSSFMSKNKKGSVILAMKRTDAKLLFFENPDFEQFFAYTIDEFE